jgi:hypothetical protein
MNVTLESKGKSINSIHSGQPIMFQRFNDDTQSLQNYLLVQDTNSKRMVYFMGSDQNLQSKDFSDYMIKSSNPKCMSLDQTNTQVLSNTKGSSTIDINGDCSPDLVLETVDTSSGNKNYLEFYISTTAGYCLVDNRYIKDDYLMASFSDLGRLAINQTTTAPTI